MSETDASNGNGEVRPAGGRLPAGAPPCPGFQASSGPRDGLHGAHCPDGHLRLRRRSGLGYGASGLSERGRRDVLYRLQLPLDEPGIPLSGLGVLPCPARPEPARRLSGGVEIMADYLLAPALLYSFTGTWLNALVPQVPIWVFILAFVAINTFVTGRGSRLPTGPTSCCSGWNWSRS